jgi:hypothetical protein
MNAFQYEGVRLHKYEVKPDEVTERDHDWVVMRYAEIVLMKAECLIRLGTPELARTLMAQIRTRANMDMPVTINLEFLDDELMREFVFEGHRRTDNIRSGDYFKGNWITSLSPLPNSITPSTEPYTGLFPVPESEIKKNSRLIQNPGY